MKPTDYASIAHVLGISVSEARELEFEQRRWREYLDVKEEPETSARPHFVHH